MMEGKEPIFNLAYWGSRLELARTIGQLHTSVFRCPLDRWRRIEESHAQILRMVVRPDDNVLDAACGYGRLVGLMPPWWNRCYTGVDISPDMVDMASYLHPGFKFAVADLRCMPEIGDKWFDLAVVSSVRPMVRRNAGDEAWDQMQAELARTSRAILFLEYDEADRGQLWR